MYRVVRDLTFSVEDAHDFFLHRDVRIAHE